MRFRQKLVAALATLLVLVLAAASMGIILSKMRPITTERLVAPDIQ
ncbi:MAG: hypothetical protein WA943_10610 [Parvibaculum sp.]